MAKAKRILIAATSTEWGYQRETLLGIREYAESQRWALSVQLIGSLPQTEMARRNADGSILDLPEVETDRLDVDGIILDQTEGDLYQPFAGLPGPKVSYCDAVERSPLPRVRLDNVQAGRLAAQHFLERNIKEVAFFGADRGEDYALQRQAGFVDSLGRKARFQSIPQTTVMENRGRAFRDWLERTPKPVGLLAVDDYLARRIAQRCLDWEINVPRDVLILGINNDVFHCEFCQPSLSSVIVPSRAIGYKAAEMLDTLMQGRRLSRNEFLIPSPGIVERESTKTTAFGCVELDRALRFVRQNAARAIGVKQVVEFAGVSKRSLELLFMNHLGHGPGEELRRARLALAKFYLTTTNRPITEVARLSGFSDAGHLVRVLQRYEKQTPLAYRRKHASVGG